MGHAVIALLRSGPISSYIVTDGEELYKAAQAIDGYDDTTDGTSVVAALTVLKDRGWITGWSQASTYDGLMSLLELGPVVIDTDWYINEALVDRNDRIHPNGNATPARHAIMIYGSDREYAYFQNSWGQAWGGDGRATMPLRELEESFTLGDIGVYQPYKQAYRVPFRPRGTLLI